MGGDENSWGQGQAWLPLWKSPPHPPLHRGAEGDSPLPAQMYACCPFFMPRVRKAEVGCGNPEVKVDPGKDQPGLLLVTPHIGPLTSRKVTCTELTPSPSGSPRASEPLLGERSASKYWTGREELLSRQNSIPTGVFFLSLSQQAELCEGHSPASLPDTLALRSRSAGVGSHLSKPLGEEAGGAGLQGGPECFPISLCDLIGILAQVLARMMGPDPLPRNSPQGPLFCNQESPGGGRGASTFSAPALSSCPPRRPPRLGAWGQRRPRQAPPRAVRAPPATRPPQSPTPGAPDGYELCSHASGTAPAPTPGLEPHRPWHSGLWWT